MLKRTHFLPLALLAGLGLSACSPSGGEAEEPTSEPTMMPVEPDGGIGDGAGPPPFATADTIPEAFLGVWDYVEGTCAPESDLRVEITPKAMQFYESYGEVTSIEVEGPDRITVTLAMAGEGETWEMERVFTLSDNGETLTPTFPDDDRFEPMPLKKCE
ncbi:hypothetical protein [Qipengyuania flava]|uniref:hypothetical protein n=1 Tax=Qipengyuania flava TaxID=192812 RepID=UPI001C629D3D|nr:hypothetical protein [Qipengyuania flava]QYJ07794.1 hypothetical protein KUV82_03515 [Qipengyuania flava]